MVDDSIVRGTTCGRLVKLLRDAGATQGELPVGQERVPWGITVSVSYTHLEAIQKAYADVKKIHFDKAHYRTDIGVK